MEDRTAGLRHRPALRPGRLRSVEPARPRPAPDVHHLGCRGPAVQPEEDDDQGLWHHPGQHDGAGLPARRQRPVDRRPAERHGRHRRQRPAGKHLPQPAADPDLLPHRRHRPHHAGLLQLRCRSRPRRTAHLHVQHLRNGCHGHLRRPVPHLPDGRRPSSFKDHRPPRLRADEVRRFLYRLPEECAGSDARAWRHGRRHDRHARDIRFHVLIGGLPWYSFRT